MTQEEIQQLFLCPNQLQDGLLKPVDNCNHKCLFWPCAKNWFVKIKNIKCNIFVLPSVHVLVANVDNLLRHHEHVVQP